MKKLTKKIQIGSVSIGGGEPVRVQTMLDYEPDDVKSALFDIARLKELGCEIIRISLRHKKQIESFENICRYSPLPVVADIHFDGSLAINALEFAHKVRVNPSNFKDKKLLKKFAQKAKEKGIPVRIGVNTGGIHSKGALSKEGLLEKALAEMKKHIELFEAEGAQNIVLSIKSSDPALCIAANEKLSELYDYPLHIGLTEAGTLLPGLAKSAYALGALLSKGIGDSLRVSLSEPPDVEVKAAWEILRAAGVRRRGVEVIACPECGRKHFNAGRAAKLVEERLSNIKDPITIAVMGCVVNGPGEASRADYAIVGSPEGTALYRKGKVVSRSLIVAEALHNLQKLLSEDGVK